MSEVMELIAKNEELLERIDRLTSELNNEKALVQHLKDNLKSANALLESKKKDESDNKDPLVFVKKLLDVIWDENDTIEGYVAYLRRVIAHMTIELLESEKDITD